MQRSSTRLLILILGLLLFVVASAWLYQLGMDKLEGKPRSFMDALEWSVESLSTTGYGHDSHWDHPLMVILVITVQFVGVFLVFLMIPVFLLPFLSERFEQRVPRTADEMMTNHVLVYRYGPAVESLLQRLNAAHVRSLVVETDEAQARAVMEGGQEVVFSRSEEDALEVGRIHKARAVVANGKDQENAALILRARHMGFRGEVYAFVEEPPHRKPMELAGATAAYTPRHIVAAALAAHASDKINPRLPGIEAAPSIRRRDVRIPAGSPAAGKKFSDVDLRAVVVGQWVRSRLQAPCTVDMRIEPGGVLELVGDDEAIRHAVAATGGTLLRDSGPFLVAGFGEVGRKVHQLLADAGEEVRVIERNRVEHVDVVGDVLDSFVLEAAGIRTARALILALDSDDSTLFATVIARDTAPDVPVIARVNHGRNLENIHRAGADFALSISDVSGEMLSTRLLGRNTRSHDAHNRVTRVDGSRFAGQKFAAIGSREAALSILGVERGGAVSADPSLEVQKGDALWLCGSSEHIRRFAAPDN